MGKKDAKADKGAKKSRRSTKADKLARKGRSSTTKSLKSSRKSSVSSEGKHKDGKSRLPDVSIVSDVEPSVEQKPPVCNDLIQPLDPCKYTADSCCIDEVLCRPNHYPGQLPNPQTLAVAGSESGTYDSICKLLRAGFLYAERILAMTPWGNFVIFRAHNPENKIFFLFDGCTCNVNRFRYMDLNCGTAGLLYFNNLHDILAYIMQARESHENSQKITSINIDEVCKNYCKY